MRVRSKLAAAGRLAVAAFVAIATGCGSEIDNHGCRLDTDCANGLFCHSDTGLCGPPSGTAPAAPENLRTTISFEQVVLTWDPVPGATSYDVYFPPIGDEGEPPPGVLGVFAGKVSGTTFTGPVPTSWRFAMLVRSVGNGGLSAPSKPAIVERLDPGLVATNLTVTGTFRNIVVRWDPPSTSFEPAVRYMVFASDASGGPFQQIGVVFEASATDGGPSGVLPHSTTRYYRVRAFSDRFAGPISAVVSGTTLAPLEAPAHLVARRIDATTVALSWDAVLGARAYDVLLDGKVIDPIAWQLTSQDRSAPAFVDFSAAIDGLAHTYAVRAVTSEETTAFSGPISILAVPPAPLALTAEVGETRVQLRWAEVPTADSFVVSRAARPTPLSPLAEVTSAGYLDAAAPATSQIYWVQAKNAAGFGPASAVGATPFPDADQANPGADPVATATLDDAHSLGQTFVVSSGGLLKGIELSTSCAAPGGCGAPNNPTVELDSGGVAIASAFASFSVDPFPCCAPAALLAGGFHGRSYFAFDDGLPVSAGQRLRVVIDSNARMLAATTGDSYAGGTLEEGRSDPGRDLVFRTEVLPATGDLTQPGTPRIAVGVGQVQVSWAPSPLATTYTVLRSTDGSSFTSVGTTSDAFLVDTSVTAGTAFYQVLAAGAAGSTRVSRVAAATLPAWSLAASNLAVTGIATMSDGLSQTFTAEKTGEIFRLEFALGAAPDGSATHARYVVDVLDDAGNLLATSAESVTRVASCCGAPPDLSAGAFGTAIVGFFAPVPVTADQLLELRLRATTALVAGTSANVYAGGTLKVGGVPDPTRDLAFKVVVQ